MPKTVNNLYFFKKLKFAPRWSKMKLKMIFVGVKDFIDKLKRPLDELHILINHFFIAYLFFLSNPALKRFFKRYIRYLLCTRSSFLERGDIDKEIYCVMIIKSHSEKLINQKRNFKDI